MVSVKERDLVHEHTCAECFKAIICSDEDEDEDDSDYLCDDCEMEEYSISLSIQSGPTIRQQVAERILPSQFFDAIAESAGMIWFVDYDKKVNLKEFQVQRAPLPVVSGEPTLDIDNDITNFFDWTEEESIEAVGTKSILRDTAIRSDTSVTDKFVWNTGDDTKFALSRKPFSELDLVSVVKASVTQTQKLEDVDREASDDSTAPGETFIYVSYRYTWSWG